MSKLQLSFSLMVFLFILGLTGESTLAADSMLKSASLIQSDGTHIQLTHGDYMNNTESCANCHQTHSSGTGTLLFENDIYQTCTVCHDGTLGFYNIYTQDNSAGTFGGTVDGNMSVHTATGIMNIKAAPGSNNNATEGHWTDNFTCISCHNPHGSFSDRLLKENPNDMADTPIKEGGQKIENIQVIDRTTLANFNTKIVSADQTFTNASGSHTVNYIVYRFNIGDIGSPTNPDYTAKGLKTGDIVLQVMKWDGEKYVIDEAPWLQKDQYDTAFSIHYSTAFYDGSTKYPESYADPTWAGKQKEMFGTNELRKGEVLGAGFAGVILDTAKFPGSDTLTTTVNTLTSGKVARSYVVKLDVAPSSNPVLANQNVTVTNVSSLWASELADGSPNLAYKRGQGAAMSSFCSACHTDYLANSGNESGTFDHAYRHTTTTDTFTCVRCHYPHGTDVTVMRDARGKTYDDIMSDTIDYPFTGATYRAAAVKDYLIDQNPSSALKRYTNMAVCLACHTSSQSGGIINSDSYQYNPS